MAFGDLLKETRTILKVTQKELSEKTGISQSIISEYEKNSKMPSIDYALKIAKALNVSIAFLSGESDIPLTSTNDISVIIKQKLSKFDTIESKNLKSQLKDIAKKLNDIADEL